MVENEQLAVAGTIAQVRRTVAAWRARGETVGVVPTMGALHAGHLALVARARAENDRVVASIFVNPLQFGPHEDFEAYPRDHERDLRALQAHRCDAAFVPSVGEMFGGGRGSFEETATRVSVSTLASTLCGRSRPGHFDGVCTIVLKLFNIVQADTAYFGEKDYQQLTIVTTMARELNVPVRVVGVPIVREPDGLALSSRNVYLTAEQRAVAPHLQRALGHARTRIAAGDAVGGVLAEAAAGLTKAGFDRVDYLTLADGTTLETLAAARPGARLFGAAWLGRTRLIDNLAV